MFCCSPQLCFKKNEKDEDVRHFLLMSHNIKWNLRLEANAASIIGVIFTAHKRKYVRYGKIYISLLWFALNLKHSSLCKCR